MARLLSLNVGRPRDINWNGKTVRTAIWKFPVEERRMVRRLNIDGDAQADLAGHGGEQRAVFVYQEDSYRYWERVLGRTDFTFGQFGENFTVEGLADDEVCIGDRYRIGGAVFEVTQPRVTCYRVGIRMNEPRMPAMLVAHRRPGFYFRVLQEGEVGAGDDIARVSSDPERITVAEVDALLYLPGHSRVQLQRALRVPALSKGWQSSFQAMLKLESGTTEGNRGLANEDPAPEWPGFRGMRVAQIRKESASVTSFILVSIDGQALPVARPGQFVVLRLQVDPDKPPVIRSYSLSDLPGTGHYRISVKNESSGLGSSFLCNQVREHDTLDVNAGDLDAARTCRREVRTTGLVDLCSPQSCESSFCGRVASPAKATTERTSVRRIQQARFKRPTRIGLRRCRAHRRSSAREAWRITQC